MGLGLYPRPYEHQSQALTAFLGDEEAADLVIATGTGSGKTESFLMPVIGTLAIEGAERPDSASMPGCRAMLLYPMNALANDQLARIRRILGEADAAGILQQSRGFPIRFGSYAGRTPYPGKRDSGRDERFIIGAVAQLTHVPAQDCSTSNWQKPSTGNGSQRIRRG